MGGDVARAWDMANLQFWGAAQSISVTCKAVDLDKSRDKIERSVTNTLTTAAGVERLRCGRCCRCSLHVAQIAGGAGGAGQACQGR